MFSVAIIPPLFLHFGSRVVSRSRPPQLGGESDLVLFQLADWLGGRDSNPDNVVQRRPKRSSVISVVSFYGENRANRCAVSGRRRPFRAQSVKFLSRGKWRIIDGHMAKASGAALHEATETTKDLDRFRQQLRAGQPGPHA